VSAAKKASREDAFDLEGRVVDDQGQPVTSFLVVASPLGDEDERGFPVSDSNSSPDGSFRMHGLQPGPWELTAENRGDRRSAPIVVTVPDERANLVLVLPRAAIVAGVVVDGLGRLLAKAQVHVGYAGDGHELERSHRTRATTDASGRFRIEDLMPGKVFLMATNSEVVESEWIEVAVGPGETRDDVRLELGSGGRIEGSIDPSLGELAHREVSLNSSNGMLGWRKAESDASGRFVIEGVIPQAYVISLMQTVQSQETIGGYVSEVTTTSAMVSRNITVENGRTTEVVFGGPERSIVVRGRVTSAGQPLLEAEVGAAPQGGIEETGSRAATGLDGRYELTVRAAGVYRFDVSIHNDSFQLFERAVPDQDVVELSFEVPSGALSGRVLGADGQPLRRVPISAVRSDYTDTESFYGDAYRRMYTADDGSFAFRLLTPGSYTLRAPDGFQRDSPPPRVPHGRVVLPELEVDAAEVSGIELRLPPEGRVSGVVVDARGIPAAGAWICLLDEQGLSLSGDWETQTDATGHFEVASVARGTYTVLVQTPETQTTSAPVSVEAGETATARIELR